MTLSSRIGGIDLLAELFKRAGIFDYTTLPVCLLVRSASSPLSRAASKQTMGQNCTAPEEPRPPTTTKAEVSPSFLPGCNEHFFHKIQTSLLQIDLTSSLLKHAESYLPIYPSIHPPMLIRPVGRRSKPNSLPSWMQPCTTSALTRANGPPCR